MAITYEKEKAKSEQFAGKMYFQNKCQLSKKGNNANTRATYFLTQMCGQTGGQTGREAGKQTERQAERETEGEQKWQQQPCWTGHLTHSTVNFE